MSLSFSTTSCSCSRRFLLRFFYVFKSTTKLTSRLVKEAAIEAKRSGERGITARSVKKVTGNTVLKFKG